MGAVRIVVEDVDAEIAALRAAGYTVTERWGPPFAILSGDGPDLWVSGPGTSAAQASAQLSVSDAAEATVRLVLEVEELEKLETSVDSLVAAGWERATEPVSGPGGTQQLVRRGAAYLEIFAPR